MRSRYGPVGRGERMLPRHRSARHDRGRDINMNTHTVDRELIQRLEQERVG